jgi:hypothetical protein
MVELTIDTSGMVNGETFEREEFIDPAEEVVVHLENLLNGVQAFEAMLVGLGVIDAKAALQINSTTKVFAPPRQTSAQRLAISGVLQGGLVYDTDEDAPIVFDGVSWHSMAAIATSSKKASAYVYYSGSSYSFSPNVNYVIPWNASRYDTDGMFDTDDDPSKLTANTAGKFAISGTMAFPTNGAPTTSFLLEILLNGTTVIASARINNLFAINTPCVKVFTLYELDEGDYVQLRLRHNNSTSRPWDPALSHFSAHLQLAPNGVSLLDTFSTPESAPIDSPRDADIGTWVFTQTDGQFAIV